MEDAIHLQVDKFVSCPVCGQSPMRPNVVWFSEVPHHLDEIERAVARATTFVAIGTSGAVYPAAAYLAYARAKGAKTIVQGLAEPDNLDERDEFLAGRASEVVPALVGRLLA